MSELFDFLHIIDSSSKESLEENLRKLHEKLKHKQLSERSYTDVCRWFRKFLCDKYKDSGPWLNCLLDIAVTCFANYVKAKNSPTDILKSFLECLVEPICEISIYACCALMEKLLLGLFHMALDDTFDLIGRFEILTTLNVVLSKVPGELRSRFWCSRDLNPGIREFGSALLDLGDFDLQAHAAALLLRLVPRKWQKTFALTQLGIDQDLAEKFSSITGSNFETGMRSWLNSLNRSRLKNPRIVSLPCLTIKVDNVSLSGPLEFADNQEEFWLDFNLGTQRITAYCIPPFPNSSTQASVLNSETQPTWEILSIYPELIDILDITAKDQLIALQFMLSESICDICDWAHSITGKNITIELNSDAIDSQFCSIQFTDIAEDSLEGGLIRILQQLQNYPCFLSQEVSTNVRTTPRACQLKPMIPQSRCRSFVATSPANICGSRTEESEFIVASEPNAFSTNELITEDTRDVERKVISASPIYCNHLEKLSPFSGSPCTSFPPGSVKIQSKSEVKVISSTSIMLPANDSTPSVHGFEICVPEPTAVTSPSKNEMRPDKWNLGHVIQDQTELSSPEKHRRADLHSSPLSTLRVDPPRIKDVDLDLSARKVSSFVMETCNHHSNEQEPVNLSSLTPYSGSAVSILSTPSEKQPQRTLIPEASELRELRVCISPCPLIYSPTMIHQTAASNSNQDNISILHIPVSTASFTANGVKKSESMLYRQQSTSFVNDSQVSSSQNSTPTILAQLRGYASANTTRFSNLDDQRKPMRKLCDTSTSLLPDMSPANAFSSLTPDPVAVLALPQLSTEVRLPTRNQSKTQRSRKKLSVRKSKKTNLTESDSDYALPANASPLKQRRSLRLVGPRKVIIDSPSLHSEECAPEGVSPSPVPVKLRNDTSSYEQPLANTPTSQNSGASWIRPVSSLKKKKHFFASSRAERIEREKKRFEQACKPLYNANKKVKGTKQPTANISNKELTPPNKFPQSRSSKPGARSFKRTSIRPSLARAITNATALLAMPINSDSEFIPDIVDSDGSLKSNSQVKSAAYPTKTTFALETLAPLLENDYIAPSWESAGPSQTLLKSPQYGLQSPRTIEQKTGVILDTSSEEISPIITSSVPSLFATTPPADREKQARHKKNKSDVRPVPIPLKFVETRRWLDSTMANYYPETENPNDNPTAPPGSEMFNNTGSCELSSHSRIAVTKKFIAIQDQINQSFTELQTLESRWRDVQKQLSELASVINTFQQTSLR